MYRIILIRDGSVVFEREYAKTGDQAAFIVETVERALHEVGSLDEREGADPPEDDCLSQLEAVNRVKQYVMEHLSDPSLTLTKIANEIVFLNADYLGKTFKKMTGERFSKYLLQQRIRQAVRIMESDGQLRVADIASRCGFGANVSYFCRSFKKLMGLTPSEFKNAVRERRNNATTTSEK
ncbi:helix-turn-helix transcriptional regulator [Paenibacillus alkalitolerans]|uniref:helix-turn-helix transcriptional regulator n=1 Tax=Paenibacillus alkalitolerans TaxID=2799335 RepID=UPI001F227BF0|nr:AraC family transcriptional regulator [Paenibacillus alkalitolerans]